MPIDLYGNCQHHWHATGERVRKTVDWQDMTRQEEACCHCGVHRWVRLNFFGERLCGPYAPQEGATQTAVPHTFEAAR